VEARWSGLPASPCPGAGVAPGRGPRRWSFSLRACVTVVGRRCRHFSCHGQTTSSSHLSTSRSFTVTRLGWVSCSSRTTQPVSPSARQPVSPSATGGCCCSARCKSSLVYQIRVLGQQNNLLHKWPPGEPCQAGSGEHPMSTFNQSAIYPRVFPKIPETPREAHPGGEPAAPGRASLAPGRYEPSEIALVMA